MESVYHCFQQQCYVVKICRLEARQKLLNWCITGLYIIREGYCKTFDRCVCVLIMKLKKGVFI